VLVLRDVLGFSAREVADLLDITVALANDALHRARTTVGHGPPEASQRRTRLDHDGVRRLAEQYPTAWETGDVEAIVGMLSEDAKYAMPPETEWYQGHHAIRAFIIEGPLTRHWRFCRRTPTAPTVNSPSAPTCGRTTAPSMSPPTRSARAAGRGDHRSRLILTPPAMSSAAAVGWIGMTNKTKQIRALIEQWAAAVRSGDMDGGPRGPRR
jgi:hypothetical protein